MVYSQLSSPTGTINGAGKNPKYVLTSSAGISLPSLSPGLYSESGRPIPELHSSTRTEDVLQRERAPD
ncbi:hypothetical protein F1880_008429 [Penicillium rolfsii]|nr:hypothetical protein F1880_008429 [Penicillium rolfsii]